MTDRALESGEGAALADAGPGPPAAAAPPEDVLPGMLAALAEPEEEPESDDETPDPIERVRAKLSIEDNVPDVTIAASLAQIAARCEARERWVAAFGSPLGRHLARRGGDVGASIEVLLALAPRRRA